jgi:hypothetical protein
MRPKTSHQTRSKFHHGNQNLPTTAPAAAGHDDETNPVGRGHVGMMAPQSPRSSSSYSHSRYKGRNKTLKPPSEAAGSLTLNAQEKYEENPLSHLLQSRIRATSAGGTNRPASAGHQITSYPIPTPPPISQPFSSPTQQHNHHQPPLSTTYGVENKLQNEYELFSRMTVDDALFYLSQHPECQFLHVTTQSALDQYSNTTFYDLVILEKPGYPESGLVWSKRDRKRQYLLHEQVMQLSSSSLLYIDEYHGSVYLPINQFLAERELVRTLRKKHIFCYYLELKVFSFWKKYLQKIRFIRRKNILETKSFFTDLPILQGRLHIHSVTYSLHSSIDLFAYHSSGTINIFNFLNLQIHKINLLTNVVKDILEKLVHHLTSIYETMISNEYLAKERECIIAHHPYSKGLKIPSQQGGGGAGAGGAGGVVDSDGNIQWDEVRAIQRLKHESIQKVVRLLVLGQYMLDHVLVDVMEQFWLRFSQQIKGIPNVVMKKQPKDGKIFADWSTEKYLQQNRSFTSHPLDHSLNSIEFQSQLLDPQHIPPTQIFASNLLCGTNVPGSGSGDDGNSGGGGHTLLDDNNHHQNYLISKQAQSLGSYLRVDVALMNLTQIDDSNDLETGIPSSPSSSSPSSCPSMEPIHIDIENNSWSITNVKVRPLPTKQLLSKLVQDIYKSLSYFLETIPNLRNHPVIIATSNQMLLSKPKVDLSEDELERLGQMTDHHFNTNTTTNTNTNSRYFTNLKMSSILAAPSLFTLSVKCMHQVLYLLSTYLLTLLPSSPLPPPSFCRSKRRTVNAHQLTQPSIF